MPKKAILVLLAMSSSIIIGAQPEVVAVQKNGRVPDIDFVLSKGDSAQMHSKKKISDFKGKLLMLDFWDVNCLSCIALMPDLLALQQKYKDTIQIILVTQNSDTEIENLWRKHENKQAAKNWIIAGRKLDFIKKDTIFHKLFPHTGNPTQVWMDKQGFFRYITDGNAATPEFIEKMFKGNNITVREKSQRKINPRQPITWISDSLSNNLQYYSFLYRSVDIPSDQYFSRIFIDTGATNTGIVVSCSRNSLLDLYSLAYSDWKPETPFSRIGFRVPASRFLVDFTDIRNVLPPPDKKEQLKWQDDNLYSYALKVPISRREKIETFIKMDLDRFFGINSSIQKRPVMCVVVRLIGDSALLSNHVKTKIKKGVNYTDEKHNISLGSVNMSVLIDEYFRQIADRVFPLHPIIDETGYKGNLNILLPLHSTERTLTLETIKNDIKQYGLDIAEEERVIDVLVLSRAN